jgi:hypothetical protein
MMGQMRTALAERLKSRQRLHTVRLRGHGFGAVGRGRVA